MGTVYDEKQDLIRVKAPAKKSDKAKEIFTIQVDEKSSGAIWL